MKYKRSNRQVLHINDCGVLMMDACIRKSRAEYRQGSDWKRRGYEMVGNTSSFQGKRRGGESEIFCIGFRILCVVSKLVTYITNDSFLFDCRQRNNKMYFSVVYIKYSLHSNVQVLLNILAIFSLYIHIFSCFQYIKSIIL